MALPNRDAILSCSYVIDKADAVDPLRYYVRGGGDCGLFVGLEEGCAGRLFGEGPADGETGGKGGCRPFAGSEPCGVSGVAVVLVNVEAVADAPAHE